MSVAGEAGRLARALKADFTGSSEEAVGVSFGDWTLGAADYEREIIQCGDRGGERPVPGRQSQPVLARRVESEFASSLQSSQRLPVSRIALNEEDGELIAGPAGALYTDVLLERGEVYTSSVRALGACGLPEGDPLARVVVSESSGPVDAGEDRDPDADDGEVPADAGGLRSHGGEIEFP